MIDYTELPQNGTKFELLIRELTLREGFIPYWTGEGSDGGRDLILEEKVDGIISPPLSRKWLVSCKHKAHAKGGNGTAVGVKDLDGLTDSFDASEANGIIVACSTHLSSSAVARLKEIENKKGVPCISWDGVELEKRLMRPHTYSLMQVFFPNSAAKLEMTVFNAGSPSFWCASYKGHFFYMSSRFAASPPNLDDIRRIVQCVETVNSRLGRRGQFGTRNHLRTRSIYYDNKHCTYLVYVDFLVSLEGEKQEFDQQSILSELSRTMDTRQPGKKIPYMNDPDWDVLRIKCCMTSDSFEIDSKYYYEKYLDHFEKGKLREDASSVDSSFPKSWVDPIETDSGLKIYNMPSHNND